MRTEAVYRGRVNLRFVHDPDPLPEGEGTTFQ